MCYAETALAKHYNVKCSCNSFIIRDINIIFFIFYLFNQSIIFINFFELDLFSLLTDSLPSVDKHWGYKGKEAISIVYDTRLRVELRRFRGSLSKIIDIDLAA